MQTRSASRLNLDKLIHARSEVHSLLENSSTPIATKVHSLYQLLTLAKDGAPRPDIPTTYEAPQQKFKPCRLSFEEGVKEEENGEAMDLGRMMLDVSKWDRHRESVIERARMPKTSQNIREDKPLRQIMSRTAGQWHLMRRNGDDKKRVGKRVSLKVLKSSIRTLEEKAMTHYGLSFQAVGNHKMAMKQEWKENWQDCFNSLEDRENKIAPSLLQEDTSIPAGLLSTLPQRSHQFVCPLRKRRSVVGFIRV